MARPELILPGDFEAAVFDFDGLLVDSEPAWARSEARLMGRRGLAYTELDRRETVGRSIDQTVAAYAERIGLPADQLAELREELIDLVRDEYRAGFALRPGAGGIVSALRPSMRLAVASSTDRDLVELALARTGLAGSFDLVVAGDEVEHPKPAPDVYLLACRELGVRASHSVAFEDSVPGVRAAKAAGLTVVAVPSMPGLAFGEADFVVDSLADVVIGRRRGSRSH